VSKPIVLKYAIPVRNFIANSQDVAAGSALILNGSSPYAPAPSGPIVFNGFQRKITLTSTTATSNAGVTFVITGTQLGSPTIVTENLVGGAGNASVQSVNEYHSIISIVATVADATAIEAGTGIGATYDWVIMDYYRPQMQYSIQGVVTNGGTISYTVNKTLDDPQGPPSSITAFELLPDPIEANEFGSFTDPITGIQLVVTNSDAATTLVFTILQQGVR
jgi:hypothetical protein